MLEVNRLSRNYGAQMAVDDVSFSVQKGEIVGLLGHNGAGKTTIMKMISGYLEPDAGSILVAGKDVASHAKQVQLNLGYLPENLPVYPEMTVADYLDYCAEIKGLRGDAKIAEIKRALHATDITSKLTTTISTLSRGYKQRVGVAQSILGQPKLLVLDEPTNGLDPEQTQQMRELIREIAKEATVILSTHILQEVSALCSRVLILRAGRLVVDETLANLRQTSSVILATDLPASQAALLQHIDGINNCVATATQPGDQVVYRLGIAAQHTLATVTAAVVKRLVAENYAVFQITPEQQDLETLFRAVTEGQLQLEVNRVA